VSGGICDAHGHGRLVMAPCGNNSAGFENWKQVQEAAARGIAQSNFALMTTTHSTGTISRLGPKEFQTVAGCFMAKAGRRGST
jgi:hypothetical protein